MNLKCCSALLLAVSLVSLSAPLFSQPVGVPGPEIWVDGPLDVKPGGDPRYPDAAVDHRSRQVFVWDSNSSEATGLAVFMRVFDADGVSLVGPVQVNSYDDFNQLYPRVAVSADGSFLVVWQSFEPPMPGDNFQRVIIRSQAYDSDGQPSGVEQVLSSLQTGVSTDAGANVAALSGGGYIAVWESFNSANEADTSYTIQGRLVGANGVPAGAQFQVNSLISGLSEIDPSVAALADGGFIVTWARPEIQGRRFASDGSPVGNDFQINTYTSVNLRDQTDVAVNEDGRVMVVWRDLEERVNDAEIRGRLYSSDLVALGPDFRINGLVGDEQTEPEVASYGATGFFVVWTSDVSAGPDAEPTSIEGRIVTGAEAFAGTQFLVNVYTNFRQQHPAIGGHDGRVAIAWFSAANEVTAENVITGQRWFICGIFCDGFE